MISYNIGTSNDEYLFEGKKKTIIEENYVFVHMQKLEKMNSNFGSYKHMRLKGGNMRDYIKLNNG